MSASVSPIHRGIVPEEVYNGNWQYTNPQHLSTQGILSSKSIRGEAEGGELFRQARNRNSASGYASRLYAAVAT